MKDVLKVFVLLVAMVAGVALYCYARVDLGMTLAQINALLERSLSSVSMWAALIWSQIFVAVVALLIYRVFRYRAESEKSPPEH